MDEHVSTADGLTLRLREWPLASARGTVLIVHGLGEHIGRHAQVATRLNAWGWRVVGHDQRGHGASDGARGRLAHRDDLLNDLARVIDATRARHPGPLVLLGHSLGGLVAARFVAAAAAPPVPLWSRPVDALVLSSPALATEMNPVQKLLLAVLGPLAPNLALHNGLRPEWLSRDASVVQAYSADPQVHDRVSPRLARFIVDAGAFVIAQAPRWPVPTLLLYAGADRCVAPSGSAAFAAVAPPARVRSHCFEALSHEIFNEPEQAEVFAVLGAWLAQQSPAR